MSALKAGGPPGGAKAPEEPKREAPPESRAQRGAERGAALSTGIERLDALLGGLRPGDNVVWEVDSGAPFDVFLRGFFRSARDAGKDVVLVSFNHSPQSALKAVPEFFPRERLHLIDCFTSGKGRDDEVFRGWYGRDGKERAAARHIAHPAQSDELRQALAETESQRPGACFIFDSLTGMLELWGESSRVLDFFSYHCPRLYDLEAVAYWVLEHQAHTEAFLANVRHVTQVVIEIDVDVGRNTLTIRKADLRRTAPVGIPHAFRVEEGEPVFVPEGREERELGVLAEIANTIGDTLDQNEMFQGVMQVLATRLGLRRGTLVLRDVGSDELRIVAAHGLSAAERRRGTYKLGEGITGQVAARGEPIALPDIHRDSRFLNRTGARAADGDRPVSFICVPLRAEPGVVGALSVDRDYISEEILGKDLRLLSIVASIVAQAVRINRIVTREKEDILAENVELRKGLADKYRMGSIIGESGPMREVLATIGTVAPSNASVLIYGETGTGKELIARAIHHSSKRAKAPFVALNCGALPDSLLESELFGHVRGAFTGAVEERKGRFELADKGTLFLDEVGDVSPRLQARLLRVLQEKQFERVGGSATITVDVRVVAATNKDLEKEVREGRFREDLYYRLNVVPLFLPPLRSRREDIALLLEHFLEKYNRENSKHITRLSQEVLDLLTAYPWPGNVRELENAVERAVVMAQRDELTKDLLPLAVRTFAESSGGGGDGDRPTEVAVRRNLASFCAQSRDLAALHPRLIRLIEEVVIRQALRAAGGSQRQAAKELGMSRTTLRKKLKDLGFTT